MGNSVDGIRVFSNIVVQIFNDTFSQMPANVSRLCLKKYPCEKKCTKILNTSRLRKPGTLESLAPANKMHMRRLCWPAV